MEVMGSEEEMGTFRSKEMHRMDKFRDPKYNMKTKFNKIALY
jgi:hypothetical protein